jgi:hypothetical protein
MLRQIFSFLSGGLVGGFLGGFLGGVTKFFWDKWLPDRMTWKREQTVEREKLMSQFSGPATRAFHDLERRIFGTVEDQARDYEDLSEDGHKAYYIDSTTFLLARCYAWLEILRDRMGILDYADLIVRLDQVSASFAGRTRGFRIFRLEQREIGERMVLSADTQFHCTGYAEFLDDLEGNEGGIRASCYHRLRDRVELMLEHWPLEVIRLINIQHALLDVVNLIDPNFRWVPEEQRVKLDSVQVIAQLVDGKLITGDEAETLRKQAAGTV